MRGFSAWRRGSRRSHPVNPGRWLTRTSASPPSFALRSARWEERGERGCVTLKGGDVL